MKFKEFTTILNNWATILLFLLVTVLLLTSCDQKNNNKDIQGSWWLLDSTIERYTEIHIDDSLYVLVGGAGDVVVPFDYKISGDSLFFFGKPEPFRFEVDRDLLFLSKKDYTLTLKRLDTTICDLYKIFTTDITDTTETSLNNFNCEVVKRMQKWHKILRDDGISD